MFVKFNHVWGRHAIGAVADIELTLSRRLVGMGICEYKTDLKPKTTPDFQNVVEEPEKEPEKEPDKKEEPEPEKVEEPVEDKKPPKRKYTKPEKAVKIEK